MGPQRVTGRELPREAMSLDGPPSGVDVVRPDVVRVRDGSWGDPFKIERRLGSREVTARTAGRNPTNEDAMYVSTTTFRLPAMAGLLLLFQCAPTQKTPPVTYHLPTFDAGEEVDAGDEGGGPIFVECDQISTGALADNDACKCLGDGFGGTGMAVTDDTTCPQDESDGQICCADDDYPGNGSCTCQASGVQWKWGCRSLGDGPGGCECGYNVGPADGGIFLCNNTLAPYSDCYTDVLLIPGESSCNCGSNPTVSAQKVTDCTTEKSAGLTPYPTSCPSTTKEVESCATMVMVTTPPPSMDAGGVVGSGCDPETCVDGTGCACTYPLNSPGSRCVCPSP
jgi:hypothetical protein